MEIFNPTITSASLYMIVLLHWSHGTDRDGCPSIVQAQMRCSEVFGDPSRFGWETTLALSVARVRSLRTHRTEKYCRSVALHA